MKADDGTEYQTTESLRLDEGGQASATVEAVEAGAGGAQAAGAALRLQQSVAGVDGQATVAEGGVAEGVDRESDSAVLRRIQRPPHGGVPDDYETWALEVAGVTRAWPMPRHLGPYSVGLYIAADDAADGPIPSQQLIDAVAAYIEDGRRPITAELTVMAPIPVPLNLRLRIEPDSDLTREGVREALRRHLREHGRPGGTLRISRLRTAIALAAGVEDYDLELPTADIVYGVGELPALGEIEWL